VPSKRKPPPVAELGRAQEGRPTAAATARVQADAERTLIGALTVPIEQVIPDPGQPRRAMDPERLAELTASIGAAGIHQPLIVREMDTPLDDGRTRYMIVAGERRYQAALRAGLARIPVLVRASEGAVLRTVQLTENLQREDLSPLDEARALRELMSLEDLDTRGVAARIHRSIAYVSDRLGLVRHEDVAAAVERGEVAPSLAAEIARHASASQRQDLLRQARAGTLSKREIQRQRQQAALPRGPVLPAASPPLPSSPSPMPTTVAPAVSDELPRLIAQAGGPAALLSVLRYAEALRLSLADLIQAIAATDNR